MAQNKIRSQWMPDGNAASSARSAGQADRVQHAVGQDVVRLGVHADRPDSARTTDHSAAVARCVGDATDHAVGPAWFALVPLEDWNRREARLGQRDAGRSTGR